MDDAGVDSSASSARMPSPALAPALDQEGAVGCRPDARGEHRRERRLRPLAGRLVPRPAVVGRTGRTHCPASAGLPRPGRRPLLDERPEALAALVAGEA